MRGLYMEPVMHNHKNVTMERIEYLRACSLSARKLSYPTLYEFMSWIDYGCTGGTNGKYQDRQGRRAILVLDKN